MKREQDGAIITQFDYPTCESLGLIKMDFLGLRNLTVLDDALRNIKANRGETVVLEDLPLDDPTTYDLLARGDTLGVFQLDGGPMRALLRSMRPDNFEDISAVGALYRPGPMGANAHNEYADRKNGRKPVMPIHPELEEPLAEILGDTYGLIVYQEQVMAIAQQRRRLLARPGRPAAARDGQEEEVRAGQAVRELLRRHGRARATRQAAVKTLWDILLPFSDYAFNKAHSAAYGLVSLLDRLPQGELPRRVHGRAAHLVGDDKDKSAIYLAECRTHGHHGAAAGRQLLRAELRPGRARDIRFGLSAVRNVGTGVVASLVAQPARRRASSPTSPTSCRRWTRWSATRRWSSR